MRACEALLPADRDPFLRALAHRLRGELIGDGSLGRAIRDVMHSGFFRAPIFTNPGTQHPARLRKQREAEAIED
jgi:hypothetical protein